MEGLASRLHALYVSESYDAAAIVTREKGSDVPYMCKFAVAAKSQGEGAGNALWAELRANEPRLYWRSRAANPINPWYFARSDGNATAQLTSAAVGGGSAGEEGMWRVFWYGVGEDGASGSEVAGFEGSGLSSGVLECLAAAR